jgi:hypothetical protein
MVPDLTQLADDDVVARAERLTAGTLTFYGATQAHVGWPIAWDVHPLTGHRYPPQHWTQLSDDDPVAGDVKDVWEPSRWTWVYLLARAWARTADDRWPEMFWDGVESWMDSNPPNRGINWRCGQESSLRGLALQFGLSVWGDHPCTTEARVAMAGALLTSTTRRVSPTTGYALSQRNNHAISELVFLLTCEPGDRKSSRQLREALRDQVYDDGSYSQQSPTYQRLAAHALLWLRATTALDRRTTAAVDEALDRMALFLERITDPVSGWAPNYGPNDGALLLELDEAHRSDMRPTLNLLGVGDAPSESAAWLGTRERPEIDVAPSTYRTLRRGNVHVLVRCGGGRHRQSHDDQLAVDVWIDGQNVCPDPGTYRYTAPSPWRNALVRADVHSRPRTDNVGIAFGRFLTAPTAPGAVTDATDATDAAGVAMELASGDCVVRRIVVVDAHGVTTVDSISGGVGTTRANLAPAGLMGLPSGPVPTGAAWRTITPSPNDAASGWVARHYGARTAAGAMEAPLKPGQPARIDWGPRTDARDRVIADLLGSWPSEDQAAAGRDLGA